LGVSSTLGLISIVWDGLNDIVCNKLMINVTMLYIIILESNHNSFESCRNSKLKRIWLGFVCNPILALDSL